MAFADMSIRAFVEQLASDAPVPGGGAASAITGGLGAALVSMVAGLSVAHADKHGHGATRLRCDAAGRDLAARFLALADADADAFAGFGAAMKLPKTTEDERQARSAAIRAAARSAAEAPLAVMEACLAMVRAAEDLAGRSNPNLASDLVVASLFAEAAARGAAANVDVNLPLVKDPPWQEATARRVAVLQAGIDLLGASTRYVILSGVARKPEQSEEPVESARPAAASAGSLAGASIDGREVRA